MSHPRFRIARTARAWSFYAPGPSALRLLRPPHEAVAVERRAFHQGPRLPLRRRASLSPVEEEALYEAIPKVLDGAVEAILDNPHYDESKQDRSFMKVHAKGGKQCPRCGHRISQLGSNREPLNFCRGCQK